MAYSVDNYSRTKTITIEDGTIDNSLDVRLIGKSYAGYGELQNENFVYLLENFAGINPPTNPINGQLWYDTNNRKIRVYDANFQSWKTVGAANDSDEPPVGLSVGDIWWDSLNRQLYVYNGSTYTLIGPQGTPGMGTTEMQTVTLKDTTGVSRTVIVAFVNDSATFVVSDIEFLPDQESREYLGSSLSFPVIKKGITLSNINDLTGIVRNGSSDIFWGTASSALGLVSSDSLKPLYTADDFVLKSSLEFFDTVKFSDFGYLLGDSGDLEVKIDAADGITPIFNVRTTNTVKFRTSNGENTPLTLVGNNILPGEDNSTDIGSVVLSYKNIYAKSFIGAFSGSGAGVTDINASNISSGILSSNRLSGLYNIDISGNSDQSNLSEKSDKLYVSDTVAEDRYRTASVNSANTGSPNSIAVRDNNGNLNAVLFQGAATTALFADLAEKYLPDREYDAGTVVVIGGDAEVTACKLGDRAFGAISTNPAFMMNAELVGGVYVALKGRVPIKVIGPVNKGDGLVAYDNGCAGVATPGLKNEENSLNVFPDTFAIALETSEEPGVKLIEAVIL